ncbi:MAG: hypothetical protein OEU92_02875 [Alphaproteobacteria bacterium]|nr:hypothetical protein [Alphaproteobacteria bacterium]
MRFRAKHGIIDRRSAPAVVAWAVALMLAAPGHGESLYDLDNPALPYLQSPAEAFELLPQSELGNRVDWMTALRSGKIQPWASLSAGAAHDADGQDDELDLDVVMSNTGDLPPVTFSHASHTALLDCGSCHPALIEPLRATNRHPMVAMVEGESCGFCHGSVAFPLADCAACHHQQEGVQ